MLISSEEVFIAAKTNIRVLVANGKLRLGPSGLPPYSDSLVNIDGVFGEGILILLMQA